MTPVSTYILTYNSGKHLRQIIEKVWPISDELLIIDSGSTDKTEAIARQFEGVKFIVNKLVNFKAQRVFAEQACRHDMIFFLDSDELPDDTFIKSVARLKEKGFEYDAYEAIRRWNVLGKFVHCIYPVSCPDTPVRLYRKSKVGFQSSKIIIHEAIWAESHGKIEGFIDHYTFQTKEEIKQKLNLYTDLAAQDLLRRNESTSLLKRLVFPWAQFLKWFLVRGGYKDGKIGLYLSRFAMDYSRLKFKKALLQKELANTGESDI